MSDRTRRDVILGTIEDLVTNFLYYDRKEDEQLPTGAIEAAAAAGEITWDEIVGAFRDNLAGAAEVQG